MFTDYYSEQHINSLNEELKTEILEELYSMED